MPSFFLDLTEESEDTEVCSLKKSLYSVCLCLYDLVCKLAPARANKNEVYPDGDVQSFCCEPTCQAYTCDVAKGLTLDPEPWRREPTAWDYVAMSCDMSCDMSCYVCLVLDP